MVRLLQLWRLPYREAGLTGWGKVFTQRLPHFALGQDGTTESDEIRGIAMAEDGSVVAVGRTAGDWDGTNAGSDDFAAIRLGPDGEEIWRYQV